MMDILSFFDRNEYTKCIACGRLIKTNEFFEVAGKIGICKNCSSHLPVIPVGTTFEEKNSSIEFCTSVFFYRQPVRNLIIDYKFNSCISYGKLFAAYMYTYINALIEDGYRFDLILPVPLSEKRLKERGYNQAELLSVPLAEALGLDHSSDGLLRNRQTARQTDLTPWERSSNIENAFTADSEVVKGKSILLVDDVYTTGNTVRECAKTLVGAGAEKVYVFTLARQPGIKRSKEFYELLTK